ncbi:MAG: NHLP bacteriocin system secretion protein [Planctomycetota bacterium]|jgi:HlyD family secretion protein
MPLSNELFRESALEQLQSPEQLDKLLRVTSPRGWVALTAIWLLLVVIIAWAFLGTIPTKEHGGGIIVPGGGLQVVDSTGSGRIALEDITVGTQIVEDQVVARIGKKDLMDQLEEARSQLAELEHQNTELDRLDEREAELREHLAAEEKRRINESIEIANNRIARFEEKKPMILELIEQGVMTEIDRHEIEDSIETAQLEVQLNRLKLDQVDEELQQAKFTRDRERTQRALKKDELEGRVDLLQSQHERESTVRSPVTGRVVEIRVADQTAISAGDPILLVEPAGTAGTELEAVIFVSAATAKGRIEPGDRVALMPSTVKQEEFGFLRGTVMWIAEVPTSKSRMLAVLADNDLVEEFTREIGLPLEMSVALNKDESTPSGFEWSSKNGPPSRISAGTLCKAHVTVEEQMPISFVIPQLRRKPVGD